MLRLKDRIAIITGSASGIGRTTGRLFAQEGAKIVVADIDDERGREAIGEMGNASLFVHVDVSSHSDVARLVRITLERFGRIDILMNNAMYCEGDTVLEIDEPTWDLNMDVCLKGAYLCSSAVLPTMIEQKSGVILNIASVNGLLALGEAAYSAAKAGLISLTQSMAVEYGEYGIRVNAISPGTIRTEVWDHLLEQDPTILDRVAAWYPLKRIGQPEEIAAVALFLASDEASFTTGANFVIDGGLTAGIFRMGRELTGKE